MNSQEIHHRRRMEKVKPMAELPPEVVVFDWKEILTRRIERLMAVRLGIEKTRKDNNVPDEVHTFLASEIDRALYSSVLDVRELNDECLNTQTNINLPLLRTFMEKGIE